MFLSPPIPPLEPPPLEHPFPRVRRNALNLTLASGPPVRDCDWLRPGSGFAVAHSVLAASSTLSRSGRGSGLKNG